MDSKLAHFYGQGCSRPLQDIFEPAQKAFDQAVETFRQRSAKGSKKNDNILEATSLRDVLNTVATAQKYYASKHTQSRTRECITKVSKRIHYYGNVMDVLVQHHPEYVALAWGAMKLVFGAIVEHENLGTSIITGFCDVADALPRVELAVFLYPTDAVRQAVSVLYAYIIKFLLRALRWYEEGKIAHAIHSITKPAALRYDDLLEDIRRATRNIADFAITSSQAEQRDIHHELCSLTTMFKQFKEDMLLDQSVKASQLLECRHALIDIQRTQTLDMASSACNIDHQAAFQACLLARDNRRLASTRCRCAPFWTSSKLRAWNTSHRLSLISLQATFKDRLYIRDFGTNVIEQLLDARVAVVWVLKPMEQRQHTLNEVYKSLIQQALSFDHTSSTKSRISFQPHKFIRAHSEDDYISLLGDILQNLNLVYIIIEAGAMEPASALHCQNCLRTLSERLTKQGAATVVKIMVIKYGPDAHPQQPNDSILLKFRKLSNRKGTKLPSQPLQNVANVPHQQLRRGYMGKNRQFTAHRRFAGVVSE